MDALLRGAWNLATGLPTTSQARRVTRSRVGRTPEGDYVPVVWWTLLVLAVALAVSVVGLPFAVLLGVALVAHSPYVRTAPVPRGSGAPRGTGS